MQPLRQSRRLSKSNQDNNSGVSVSNSESPSTGGQSKQKKNKKRTSSSASGKPMEQTKKSKLSYAPDVVFEANRCSKSKSSMYLFQSEFTLTDRFTRFINR
ncbi:hypothetical protein Tco_0209729 [Tanacetum coccineum]